VKIKNSYTDVLPTLNVNFHLTNQQVLRFAAGIAVSRPPLDALITGFSLNTFVPPVGSGGGGNPTLKPYKANQVDLSYEWYFHDESLFAAALYYKYLTTFIGASSSAQLINGNPYVISGVNNFKGGSLEGLELTLQTRFYFLGGFLKNFGMYTNYAYVNSNIHEAAPASNPYTMVGVARNTGEFDLFFNAGGFESRLAYKVHSAFTVAPTWVGTVLAQNGAEHTLDASMSYQYKNIGFRLQGRNLTNDPGITTTDNNVQNLGGGGNTTGYNVYGASYLFDVSWKY
jgi:TonB-dependent receptor